MGLAGFRTLGPDAVKAVPELVKVYDCETNQALLWNISDCLGYIGPGASNAAPALLSRAKDAHHNHRYVRSCAIWALGKIHPDPKTIVPALTALLRDKDPEMRCDAANALANFGSNAISSVPILIECLQDEKNPRRQDQFRETLLAIQPEALSSIRPLKP